MIDATHDPVLESWVTSANASNHDFPIQNLPFGVAQLPSGKRHICTAIGDSALDLYEVSQLGLLAEPAAAACQQSTLNALMALPRAERLNLRATLSKLLRSGSEHEPALQRALLARDGLALLLPVHIGDYTDFYASIHHATNIGRLFRPDNPLLPNYRWVPVGYHGRASSVLVSNTNVHRPNGQLGSADGSSPRFGACERLDYELELGLYVGPGNALGEPIAMADAEAHAFGVSLLNDWSARDIQAWEYQPLGPFLGKSFATSASPWVVTMEALAPFRAPFARAAGEPEPLPHLSSEQNTSAGAIDIQFEVSLQTSTMRQAGQAPEVISHSAFTDSYWTFAQMIAHHTSNGCNLRAGDLLGSGTMSGPQPGSEGALIELTRGGAEPLQLTNGESRRFLEDGDRVVLNGWCERAGARRIGLGLCEGIVLPGR